MRKIRSFIALPLAGSISGGAAKLIRKLSDLDGGIKWVPTDNLHLTLKFLGDVDNTEVHDICEVISDVCYQFDPFPLKFVGTGAFPDLDRPRVLYIGAEDPTGALVEMVSQIETQLADLGFKPEPRDYRPHLTIGRSRNRRISAEALEVLQDHAEKEFGEMETDVVELIASFLDKGGPTYNVMDTIELGE
ncbi:RNA 2',3'-cyclic phosphodiesterase [Planctomycetes bacterium K23_9]|uniref:RNA 2',3'-cyclic phosphodiesterase n=1 Tax=Stieleria marina TaxID=1930275 RepID=A0A517NPF7_9BACT|nr:2',5' RNA ligase family [Planctomycetes bacterium K23_9]